MNRLNHRASFDVVTLNEVKGLATEGDSEVLPLRGSGLRQNAQNDKLRRLLLLVATGMSLLQTSCSRHDATTDARQPVKVQTMEVQLQRAPEIYEAAGTVRAKLTATVSAKVMATIREIPVKAGDSVRAGDELAKLDDRDLRAEYERARADYDRFKNLLEKQAATRRRVRCGPIALPRGRGEFELCEHRRAVRRRGGTEVMRRRRSHESRAKHCSSWNNRPIFASKRRCRNGSQAWWASARASTW